MQFSIRQALARGARLLHRLPWHWLVAALVAFDGYLFLLPLWRDVDPHGVLRVLQVRDGAGVAAFLDSGGIAEMVRLMLGIGVQVMAIGLLYRARLAWGMSLVLLIQMGSYALWLGQSHTVLAVYTAVLVALLIAYWRRFDCTSLTAGSLFAVMSVGSLLVYAVLGVLYLGEEFAPPVRDPITALYFSIVSMSTVGYGDIDPQTDTARLFTISIIILGITVFATSISAVVGPMIGGNVRRLMRGRVSHSTA